MAGVITAYNEFVDTIAWWLLRQRVGRRLLREWLWLEAWAAYLWAEPECLVQELIRLRAWQALEEMATEDDA